MEKIVTELAINTEYIARRLGDSLLLVKCFELLGGREADARRVAQHVARIELAALTDTSSRGRSFIALAEQFLRTIYAFQMSGGLREAYEVQKAFLKHARQEYSKSGPLKGNAAFRLCASVVFLSDPISINDMLSEGSFSARLAEALKLRNLSAIEECCGELEKYIEVAEDRDDLAPWSDVWHYVLVLRLERLLKGADG